MPAEPASVEIREALKRDCQDLQRLAREVYQKEIGYNDASIQWLAWLIEFSRNKPDEEVKKALMLKIGGFLGEALITRWGGEWVVVEGKTLGVRLPSGTVAFPFAKVFKQFRSG